jgi:ABC-2 type transport system permease protein
VIRAFAAAVRFQSSMIPRDPTTWMALALVPLQAVLFLSIVWHSGRSDLAGYAIIAPVVIAVWTTAIFNSSEMVTRDRQDGTLEALFTTPAPLAAILLGRIAAVTAFSMLALAESWLVAALGFRTSVTIQHPAGFLLTVAATAFAMAGTATALSALLVLARSARAYINSMSYPVYLLGGAMVPVGLYPGWLRPICRLVFLSWSTDLLRDAMSPPAMRELPERLAAVVLLGSLGCAAGLIVYRRVLYRLWADGTVGLA